MTNLLHVGRLVAQICERTMYALIDEEIAPSASPNLKPSRRVKQHSHILNGVSLCSILIYGGGGDKGKLLLASNEWLILTKKESSLILPTISRHSLLRILHLSWRNCDYPSIKTKSEDGDEDPASKRRSLQLFAITTPRPAIMAVIWHIYYRLVTSLRTFTVWVLSWNPFRYHEGLTLFGLVRRKFRWKLNLVLAPVRQRATINSPSLLCSISQLLQLVWLMLHSRRSAQKGLWDQWLSLHWLRTVLQFRTMLLDVFHLKIHTITIVTIWMISRWYE